jgi:hypothetical protein
MTSPADTPAEMAEKRRALMIHAIVFAVVIVLLAGLDWYTGHPYWVHWVFLGWGTGLAVHAALVMRRVRRTGA